jgi:hypothetical protein
MERGSAELMRLCKLFALPESLTKPGLDYIALDDRKDSEKISRQIGSGGRTV